MDIVEKLLPYAKRIVEALIQDPRLISVFIDHFKKWFEDIFIDMVL